MSIFKRKYSLLAIAFALFLSMGAAQAVKFDFVESKSDKPLITIDSIFTSRVVDMKAHYKDPEIHAASREISINTIKYKTKMQGLLEVKEVSGVTDGDVKWKLKNEATEEDWTLELNDELEHKDVKLPVKCTTAGSGCDFVLTRRQVEGLSDHYDVKQMQ
ncbi:MAG: hypothetical protein K0R14_1541 [Burkholderiales bacterium]|jgi:hypothetical protein|nr:hypothetical protein [Burkholderiales bacterium]